MANEAVVKLNGLLVDKRPMKVRGRLLTTFWTRLNSP